MDGDYISRHEHEEFRRSMEAENQRLEDENKRQNHRLEELEETYQFCISLGLPVTLGQLGIQNVTMDKVMAVAEAACAPTDTLHNMPFPVDPQTVAAAILAADRYGRFYLGE